MARGTVSHRPMLGDSCLFPSARRIYSSSTSDLTPIFPSSQEGGHLVEKQQQEYVINDRLGPESGGLQKGLGPVPGGTQQALGPVLGGLQQELGPELGGLQQELGPVLGGLPQELGPESGGLQQELEPESGGVHKELGPDSGDLQKELGPDSGDLQQELGPVSRGLQQELGLESGGLQKELDPVEEDLQPSLDITDRGFQHSLSRFKGRLQEEQGLVEDHMVGDIGKNVESALEHIAREFKPQLEDLRKTCKNALVLRQVGFGQSTDGTEECTSDSYTSNSERAFPGDNSCDITSMNSTKSFSGLQVYNNADALHQRQHLNVQIGNSFEPESGGMANCHFLTVVSEASPRSGLPTESDQGRTYVSVVEGVCSQGQVLFYHKQVGTCTIPLTPLKNLGTERSEFEIELAAIPQDRGTLGRNYVATPYRSIEVQDDRQTVATYADGTESNLDMEVETIMNNRECFSLKSTDIAELLERRMMQGLENVTHQVETGPRGTRQEGVTDPAQDLRATLQAEIKSFSSKLALLSTTAIASEQKVVLLAQALTNTKSRKQVLDANHQGLELTEITEQLEDLTRQLESEMAQKTYLQQKLEESASLLEAQRQNLDEQAITITDLQAHRRHLEERIDIIMQWAGVMVP